MGKLVTPKTFLIGYTTAFEDGLGDYLRLTGQEDFWRDWDDAEFEGLSKAERICSFYAKLCYKSLVAGKNENVKKFRDIRDNLEACLEAGHGSVFEHVWFNFVVTDCSRVFTHEMVRHRVGTAFSQTSGRYVRGGSVDIVFDPILEPVAPLVREMQTAFEAYYGEMVQRMGLDRMTDFAKKKKITSALRRLLPNGQANELGFSVNLRSLRHVVQVRTSRHAEWEVRVVFNDVYRIVKEKFPLVFYGANEEVVDGLLEVSGMRTQPYDRP